MHSSKFKFFKDTLLPFFLKSSRLKVQSCSSCVHSRGWRKDLGSGSGALSLSTSHQGDLWPLVSLITRLLMVLSLGKNQSRAKDDGRWSLQPITDWLRASDWTILFFFIGRWKIQLFLYLRPHIKKWSGIVDDWSGFRRFYRKPLSNWTKSSHIDERCCKDQKTCLV